VAGKIKRVKKDYGFGAIINGSGSHHTWGQMGYWLSARLRFFNSIGFTPVIHIDPFYNHTAALFAGKWLGPRPATGNALALAIAYVWITEDLYDKDYVAGRTVGFEKWRGHISGKENGIPKTPERRRSINSI
jgi:anaerobic selenocysteine-containing dehydrogenase